MYSRQDYRCKKCPEQLGFRFDKNGKCEDINECVEYGGGACESFPGSGFVKCHNLPGTYTCVRCAYCDTPLRTFDQQIIMIKSVVNHVKSRIPDNKFKKRWEKKLSEKIAQLEEATNDDKSRCNPNLIQTTPAIGGLTECELAWDINTALIDTAEEWICDKKQSRKFKKQFQNILGIFRRKNCTIKK